LPASFPEGISGFQDEHAKIVLLIVTNLQVESMRLNGAMAPAVYRRKSSNSTITAVSSARKATQRREIAPLRAAPAVLVLHRRCGGAEPAGVALTHSSRP
jgi:hypothetical protein